MVALSEQLYPGPTAVEKVTGERPHYSTFFRWTQRGVLASDGQRIRLEFVKAGSRRLTSVAAVVRFFQATTSAAGSGCTSPILSSPPSDQNLLVERELSNAGL
jgi:hypothetical protein